MSRFERIFDVACACCKADGANVPEAEATIQLLLPQIRSAFVAILVAISARAEGLLNHSGTTDADLGALLAAYVAAAQRLGARPLSPYLTRNVELAAASLMRAAAAAEGLPALSDTELRARAVTAAEQLQLQIEQVVAEAVEHSVPTAARLAQAPSSLSSADNAPAVWRGELEAALDAGQALRPLLDSWAYQTWNAASIRAAARGGHNFIQLQAKIDGQTTAFCRLVNGRVVPMARALAQLDAIDRAIAAGDVDALVAAAPFVSNPREATMADVDRALERGGLAPFHHGCRTRNVPIRLDVAGA